MLELKIFSPQENGFVPEIKWNNEELKAAIADKMKQCYERHEHSVSFSWCWVYRERSA